MLEPFRDLEEEEEEGRGKDSINGWIWAAIATSFLVFCCIVGICSRHEHYDSRGTILFLFLQ